MLYLPQWVAISRACFVRYWHSGFLTSISVPVSRTWFSPMSQSFLRFTRWRSKSHMIPASWKMPESYALVASEFALARLAACVSASSWCCTCGGSKGDIKAVLIRALMQQVLTERCLEFDYRKRPTISEVAKAIQLILSSLTVQ